MKTFGQVTLGLGLLLWIASTADPQALDKKVLSFAAAQKVAAAAADAARARPGARERGRGPVAAWRRFRDGFASGFERLVAHGYRPALTWALEWRYLTAATSVAVLLLFLGRAAARWATSRPCASAPRRGTR